MPGVLAQMMQNGDFQWSITDVLIGKISLGEGLEAISVPGRGWNERGPLTLNICKNGC